MQTLRIIRNSVWLTIADIVRRVLVVATTALLSRGLGVQGFGQYTLAQSYNLLLMSILDLGLTPFFVREIARDRDKERVSWYLARFLALRVFISVFYVVLVIFSSALLGYAVHLRWLIILQAGWVIIENCSRPFRDVFLAFEQMRYEALISTLFGIFRLGLVALTVGLALGIQWVTSSDAIAASGALVVALVIYAGKFGEINIAFDWEVFKVWLLPILPLAVLSITREAIARLSPVILSLSYDSGAVGIYEAAARLVFMLNIFALYLTQSGYPQMSMLACLDTVGISCLTSKLIKLSLALALASAVVMFAGAQIIISFIYGDDFQPSVGILRLLVWVVLPFSVGYVVNYLLIAKDMLDVALKLTVCGLAVYVLFGAPIILFWGVNGAAVATLFGISMWALLLVSYCIVKGYLHLSDLLPSLSDWVTVRTFFRKGSNVD